MTVTCARHRRWTFITRADGTAAVRVCPECPRPPACVVSPRRRDEHGELVLDSERSDRKGQR